MNFAKYIKLDSIEELKPINNNVIIRIDEMNNSYKLKCGIQLHMAISEVEGRKKSGEHTTRCGVIVAQPESFIPNNKWDRWIPNLETKIGDIVWGEYFAMENAELILVDQTVYISVPYQYLYFAKRGDEIIMLNGYCIITPLEKNSKIFHKNILDQSKARLEYIGKPNLKNNPKYYIISPECVSELKQGCIVYHRRKSFIELESGTWKHFSKENYYIIEQNHILGYE